MMKKKIGNIIFGIVLVFITVWNISSGIGGLSKTRITPVESAAMGDICELKILYAQEVYYVDHKLNFLLPIGTEHYYFVFTEDEDALPYLIKASTSWFNENFTSDGMAKKTVTVTGELKRFRTRAGTKLGQVNDVLKEFDTRVSETYYINTMYKTHYTLNIVCGALLIAAVVLLLNLFFSSGISPLGIKVRLILIGVTVLADAWITFTLEVI